MAIGRITSGQTFGGRLTVVNFWASEHRNWNFVNQIFTGESRLCLYTKDENSSPSNKNL